MTRTIFDKDLSREEFENFHPKNPTDNPMTEPFDGLDMEAREKRVRQLAARVQRGEAVFHESEKLLMDSKANNFVYFDPLITNSFRKINMPKRPSAVKMIPKGDRLHYKTRLVGAIRRKRKR